VELDYSPSSSPYILNYNYVVLKLKTNMYAASSSKQNKKQQYICNICSRIFESEEALGAHKRIEHGESTHAPAGVG
jgi:hypothetical protein